MLRMGCRGGVKCTTLKLAGKYTRGNILSELLVTQYLFWRNEHLTALGCCGKVNVSKFSTFREVFYADL